jgi:hypothetical protein
LFIGFIRAARDYKASRGSGFSRDAVGAIKEVVAAEAAPTESAK